MRKYLLTDMYLIPIIPSVVGLFVFYFIGLTFIAILLLAFVIVFTVIFCIFDVYIRVNYTSKVFYNPIIRKIEIHLGRDSSVNLLSLIREAKELAKKKKASVLFNTNHYSKDRLLKFDENLVIRNANMIQTFSYYIPYYLVLFGKKKPKKFPVFNCELYIK